jgi:glycosyltransferase involved in cell wall biosynthesis
LNASFTLFHVHANNHAPMVMVGGDSLEGQHRTGAVPLPAVLELSMIRSATVTPRPSRTIYPTPLDRPNFPGCQDHRLHFFPFLPWDDELIHRITGADNENFSTPSGQAAGRRILVDVKSLSMFASHGFSLTGIQRVEMGIASALARDGHRAVLWDDTAHVFRNIDLSLIDKLLSRAAVAFDVFLQKPEISIRSRRRELVLLRIHAELFPFVPPVGSLRERYAHFVARRFGRVYQAMTKEARTLVATRLKLRRRPERMRRFLAVAEGSLLDGQELAVEPGDVVLLLSVLPPESCIRYADQHGVAIVPLIYDLYPIYQPHLVQHASFIADLWTKMLPIYARAALLILTCSNSTRIELMKWFGDNLAVEPEIAVVPLAPGLDPETPRAKPAHFPFQKERFVLLAGSFGPNKNQAWAHMLWSRLVERIGDAALPLVFAGRAGWRAHETIESIRQDRYYNRYLYVVEAPSDPELAWLYANCAFFMQPSETEGWGLTASEGLSFGKPCLSSGRGALRESGQGVAWEADPLDGAKWLDHIVALMTNAELLEAERQRTRKAVRTRTWAEVANEIEARINGHGVRR